MFTILLAWINAAYACGYHGLFIGTVILDVLLIAVFSETIINVFKKTY